VQHQWCTCESSGTYGLPPQSLNARPWPTARFESCALHACRSRGLCSNDPVRVAPPSVRFTYSKSHYGKSFSFAEVDGATACPIVSCTPANSETCNMRSEGARALELLTRRINQAWGVGTPSNTPSENGLLVHVLDGNGITLNGFQGMYG